MPSRLDSLLTRLTAQMQRNNAYQARAEIAQIHAAAAAADPKRLEPHGFKVYSQNDEDGLIEEICRRLGIGQGRFVEMGVENGLECNSLYLIHKGWRGIWIEGNQAHKPFIEQKFASILNRRLTVAMTWVKAETVNDLLARLGVADDLDLLSIDIDGNDIYVLEALTLRPKILCIEYNAKFPANIDKRVTYEPNRTWSGTDYVGSSLKAIAAAAQAKGYRLVATNITGGNAFFVRDDLAGDLFPDDASPEALYNPARYWLYYDHYRQIGHPADFGPYVDLEAD
ncbi:MAG TPA: hypothetical protein VF495_00215 [Phenylobacterium sp.]